jgi:hypothetical protein
MHGWLHEWQPLSKVGTSEDVVKLPAACTMELYTNRPAGYLSLGWVARWKRFYNTDELGKIDASLLSISPLAVPIEDNLFIHTNLVYSSEWALPLFSATGAHDNRPVNGHCHWSRPRRGPVHWQAGSEVSKHFVNRQSDISGSRWSMLKCGKKCRLMAGLWSNSVSMVWSEGQAAMCPSTSLRGWEFYRCAPARASNIKHIGNCV